MSLGEFELIERYFRRVPPVGAAGALGAVAVGNGDDCAIIAPAPGMHLAVSTDTLVEGRHFVSTVRPERLGHKALAVNLSDLAACGARPLAFTLALTLPRADPAWLAPFAQGLLDLADAHGCTLIGGDTTGGPMAIGITVLGEVPPGQALLRSGAQPGHDIWVSGWPGQASLALHLLNDTLGNALGNALSDKPKDGPPPGLGGPDWPALRARLEQPTPRVALGLALRGRASAAIDVSDGLMGDLGHVLKASGVGALLSLPDLPRCPALAAQPPEVQQRCLLAGGDDYELVFCAPPDQRDAMQTLATSLGLPLSRIGQVQAEPGLRLTPFPLADAAAQTAAFSPADLPWRSFEHFRA